jgi:16S rRNA (cytosine1402-N4)-methyltransferase
MSRPPTTIFNHTSVLLQHTVEALTIDRTGLFLDCTLGAGGHSEAILNVSEKNTVIGIDRDPFALKAATSRLNSFGDRFSCQNGSFAEILTNFPDQYFDGILMDLGVSSPQLDNPQRGFSFTNDGPLDMRMNPNIGKPASQWLEEVTESELADIIFKYGEEPRSRRIARAIVRNGPWESTLPLAECIRKASQYRNSKTHPATRTFQAIRIAINDELSQLEKGMRLALQKLKSQARLAIISFHSLEDRLVKHFFIECTGKNAPKDAYGNPVTPITGTIIFKKGISGKEQDSSNPRARSARLRVLQKC